MSKVYLGPVSFGPQYERDHSSRVTQSERLSKALVGLLATISVFVLLILATELLSMFVLSLYRRSAIEALFANNVRLKFYRNKSWAKQYWKETEEAEEFNFSPYSVAQRKPFSGQYVNVDAHGVRRTANPDCSPTALRIWMFGGSSLWGMGAKDDETIPSILSAKYSRSVGPVCVTNFGEDARVSTQEIIQLEIELKQTTNLPNLVLFLDGYGDSYTSYQSGGADTLMNFQQLQQKMETRRTGLEFLKESNTHQMLAKLMSGTLKLKKIEDTSAAAGASRDREMVRDAHMAAKNYLENKRLLQSLSEWFGFRYYIFWTPVAFLGNKPLDSEERKASESFQLLNPGILQLCRMATDLVLAAGDKHIINITDVFDHTPDQVYVDYGHTNSIGNLLIAERMLETIGESSCPSQRVR